MAREIPADYWACTPDEKLTKTYAANSGNLSHVECIDLMLKRSEISADEAARLKAAYTEGGVQ